MQVDLTTDFLKHVFKYREIILGLFDLPSGSRANEIEQQLFIDLNVSGLKEIYRKLRKPLAEHLEQTPPIMEQTGSHRLIIESTDRKHPVFFRHIFIYCRHRIEVFLTFHGDIQKYQPDIIFACQP